MFFVSNELVCKMQNKTVTLCNVLLCPIYIRLKKCVSIFLGEFTGGGGENLDSMFTPFH